MNPGGLGYGARKASQLDKEGSEKDDSGDGIAVRVRLGNAPGSTVARWTHCRTGERRRQQRRRRRAD
jgi:hypothetical protein